MLLVAVLIFLALLCLFCVAAIATAYKMEAEARNVPTRCVARRRNRTTRNYS